MIPKQSGDLTERAWVALSAVHDPEIPSISIVDLGLVENVRAHEKGRIEVDLLPTFTGCPALGIIEDATREALLALADVDSVTVRFLLSPAWSTDRITPKGRRDLKQFGIAPPARSVAVAAGNIACPYCGSTSTVLESAFGPTRCRTIYYCRACRNPFEKIKEV